MKKLMFIVVAAMAVSFTSCGNKSGNQSSAEQTEASTAAAVDMENATADLAAQLEAGDANRLQQAIEAAQAKVAELLKENPELAKEYLTKVQNFLKENAEKIKTVVGDNAAVQMAVSAIADVPAESIITSLQSKLEAVGNAGQEAVNAAQAAGQEAVNAAQAAGQEAVDAAKQAAQDQVDAAKQAAQDKVDEAKQKAGEKVEEARQKANEKVNEAASKAMKGLGL